MRRTPTSSVRGSVCRGSCHHPRLCGAQQWRTGWQGACSGAGQSHHSFPAARRRKRYRWSDSAIRRLFLMPIVSLWSLRGALSAKRRMRRHVFRTVTRAKPAVILVEAHTSLLARVLAPVQSILHLPTAPHRHRLHRRTSIPRNRRGAAFDPPCPCPPGAGAVGQGTPIPPLGLLECRADIREQCELILLDRLPRRLRGSGRSRNDLVSKVVIMPQR